MATIKEAVHNASAFAVETLGPERTAGLRLEEVDSASVSGGDAWLITLSMVVPPESAADALHAALNGLTDLKRDYKIFTVLKKNGEVTSMKIRELAAA